MATKDTGIVNIHGKEYLTVAKRVQDFREKHKDEYGITTEIVERNDDVVVIKASITKNVLTGGDSLHSYVVATGYAEEKRSSSQINRTSALENAETSAIGRALAAFGMAGSEYASADEVAQAIHQQGSSQPALRASTTDAPSEKQLNLVRDLSKQLGIDPAMYEQRIALLSTKAEASAAIEKLQAAIKKKGEE